MNLRAFLDANPSAFFSWHRNTVGNLHLFCNLGVGFKADRKIISDIVATNWNYSDIPQIAVFNTATLVVEPSEVNHCNTVFNLLLCEHCLCSTKYLPFTMRPSTFAISVAL